MDLSKAKRTCRTGLGQDLKPFDCVIGFGITKTLKFDGYLPFGADSEGKYFVP